MRIIFSVLVTGLIVLTSGCTTFHFKDDVDIQDLSAVPAGAPVPVVLNIASACEAPARVGGGSHSAIVSPNQEFNQAFAMAMRGSGLVVVDPASHLYTVDIDCDVRRRPERPGFVGRNPNLFVAIPYALLGGPTISDGSLTMQATVTRPGGDTVLDVSYSENYSAHVHITLAPFGIFQPFIGTGYGREVQVMAAKLSTSLLSDMASRGMLAQQVADGTPSVVEW